MCKKHWHLIRLRNMFRYSTLLRSSPQHLQQRRVRRGRRSSRRTPAQTPPRSKQSSARTLGLQAISTGLSHCTTDIYEQQAWCRTSGCINDLRNTFLADEASGRSIQRLLLRGRVLRIAIVSVARDLLLVKEMCCGPEPLILLLRLDQKSRERSEKKKNPKKNLKTFTFGLAHAHRIAWHHHQISFLFCSLRFKLQPILLPPICKLHTTNTKTNNTDLNEC